jgi:hypothetical protein
MNREDIIRMAKEAKFYIEDDEANSSSNEEDLKLTEHLKNDLTEHLERFAKLVAQHEREACAKVCEDSVEYAGDTLAEAIRARGYKQDGQCKLCTDGCPACDATKLPKEAHDLF